MYSYPNGHSNGHSYSHQENSTITRTSSHHNTPPLRHSPSGGSHSFSSSIYPDGSYNQSSSSASGSHSQGSHSRETIHAETNKHHESEFNNTFNYSIDLGGEHSVFKNRSVHVLATNQSHSNGYGVDVEVVTGSGVETITTATLSPEDNFPVPVPNPIDRCRADDKVRCGDSSIFICTDQECDGHSDCPGGEDEENCPIEGIRLFICYKAALTT